MRLLLLLGAALAGVALTGAALGLFWPELPGHAVGAVLGLVAEARAAGWLLVVLVQVLIVVSGVLPASLVGVTAGALYGVPLGFALAAGSTMAGAVLAFALSRSLFRPLVARRLAGHARLGNLDAAIARDGWKLVCLLRVSPVMPFAVTSYALGLSSIGFRPYLLGTLLALPALLGFVATGAFAGQAGAAWEGELAALRLALLGLGAVATVVATLLVGRLARRALARAAPAAA
jgi:uncharacterized membrane protein YdjX (TVP38/TMEM64 family)